MLKERGGMFIYLCAGFAASGISCSLYVSCGLGSDAFNLMTQGVSAALGIQVGNAFYIIQGAMLLAVFALRRRGDRRGDAVRYVFGRPCHEHMVAASVTASGCGGFLRAILLPVGRAGIYRVGGLAGKTVRPWPDPL